MKRVWFVMRLWPAFEEWSIEKEWIDREPGSRGNNTRIMSFKSIDAAQNYAKDSAAREPGCLCVVTTSCACYQAQRPVFELPIEE